MAAVAEELLFLAKDAAQERERLVPGEVTDDPVTIHEQLLLAQSVVDRLEEIVSNLSLAKAETYDGVKDAEAEVETAVGEVVANPMRKFGNEYASAVEKNAMIKTATLNEQVALRAAEKLDRDVGNILEFVKTKHWGARGVLRTLEMRIKLIGMDSAFGGRL